MSQSAILSSLKCVSWPVRKSASPAAQPASSLRPGWIRAERTLNGEDAYGVVKRFITALDIDATFQFEAAAAELHYIGKTNPALELARKAIAVVWETNKDVKASDDEKGQVGVHVGSGDNDNFGDDESKTGAGVAKAKRVDESKTGAGVANAAAEGDNVKDNHVDADESKTGADNVKDNHVEAKRVAKAAAAEGDNVKDDESKTGAGVANAAAAEGDNVKDNDGDTKRSDDDDNESKTDEGGDAKRVDESKTGAEVAKLANAAAADDDDVKDRAGEAERVAERETSAEVGDVAAAEGDNVKDKGVDAERVDASKTGAEVENAITAGDEDDVKDNHQMPGRRRLKLLSCSRDAGENEDDVGAEVVSKIFNGGGTKVNTPGDDEATGSLAVATGIDED